MKILKATIMINSRVASLTTGITGVNAYTSDGGDHFIKAGDILKGTRVVSSSYLKFEREMVPATTDASTREQIREALLARCELRNLVSNMMPGARPPHGKLSVRWRHSTGTWVVYEGRRVAESGFEHPTNAQDWIARRYGDHAAQTADYSKA